MKNFLKGITNRLSTNEKDKVETSAQNSPKTAKQYYEQGLAYYDQSKYTEAVKCFDQAIVIDSSYAEAYFKKGDSLDELGEKEQAIKCYDLAIKVNPSYAEAYRYKGIALSAMGKYAEAIECYDQALKINPGDALYYCNKGKVLNNLGREHEALVCFNKAYELSQTGNLGTNLNQVNIDYINKTLTKDRAELIKKLAESQKVSTEVADETAKLDQSKPLVKKAVEKFMSFKRNSIDLTGLAIDSLDPAKVKDEAMSTIDLLKAMQAQIDTLQKELVEVKALQKEHGVIQKEQGAKLDKHEVELSSLKKATDKFTKGKLLDLEDQIDELAACQDDKTGERLDKLEAAEQTFEHLRKKLKTDSNAKPEDKKLMLAKIEAMEKKVAGIASQEGLEEVALEVKKLIKKDTFVQDWISGLEDRIDQLMEGDNKAETTRAEVVTKSMIEPQLAVKANLVGPVSAVKKTAPGTNIHKVNMITEIIYDNPILNNPQRLNELLKYYTLDEILGANSNLDGEM